LRAQPLICSSTLTLVPKIPGDLLCICGDQDPLMPPDELQAIAAASELGWRTLLHALADRLPA
jgi:dienelactone hydrolase